MFLHLKIVLLQVAFFVGLGLPVQAALNSVSGLPAGDPQVLSGISGNGNPGDVAVNLANGFPLWYQDDAGLKLQLCLDTALEIAPGVVVNPCEYEPPTAAPPSFPGNFGAEAAYWTAVAPGNYVSNNGVTSSALLVLALEATGANGGALNDGNQAVSSTIRIRVDVPVAGTYRVTHPYGTMNFTVTTPGVRAINVTQSFGLDTAQNFLTAMKNDGTNPIVNAAGATIGPFLVPFNPHGGTFDVNDPATFAGGPITVNGATYIALPFAPANPAAPTVPVEIFQPVTGSLFFPDGEVDPANYFRIELREILLADGTFALPDQDGSFALPNLDGTFNRFFLNAAGAGSQVVQFEDFLLVGKRFNDVVNAIPVATDDFVATAKGKTTNINVVVNDTDLITPDNAHGINPQALALADPTKVVAPFYYTFPLTGMPQLTATQATAAGGSVRRVANIPTGKTSFFYTPPAVDFIGTDSFQYVVQDSGGLISTPATVNITVEDLQMDRADYRPRFGKWHLTGTSSDTTDNFVTLYAGPRARLTPEQEVQIVSSDAHGNVALLVSDNAIDYQLNIDPLPVSTVTSAHIHVGAAGSNGPIIFSLYSSGFGVPFTGLINGALTAFDLQPQPASGISSFTDAINAILSGQAYVNVHTTAYPAGEIRGQIQQSVIGSAPVVNGVWEFKGHSSASPGTLQSVNVESANTVRHLGTPLRLR
ncbi:MAG: CHRD domain-containing protein [Desulfuromonadales bacterium]|nr:CHRD domain-containing protein [Desulfuromonadales bacterium]